MRINVIKPQYLADQHLLAEYNEIHMMVGYIRRSLKKGLALSETPRAYTLNEGHAKFFYNKLNYVNSRKQLLVEEMQSRGMVTNVLTIDWSEFPESLLKKLSQDWRPSLRDVSVNLERIKIRLAEKPEWYRFNGVRQTQQFWDDLYQDTEKLL